jgi:hypothetical protein
MKNNYAQYTSCLDEYMKAHIVEIYMAMMENHFFSKNHVPLSMARMIYAEVVLGVQVNWRIILNNQANNVPPY